MTFAEMHDFHAFAIHVSDAAGCWRHQSEKMKYPQPSHKVKILALPR